MMRQKIMVVVLAGLVLGGCGGAGEVAAPSTVSVTVTATTSVPTTVVKRETSTTTSVVTSAVTETATVTETPPVSVVTETVTAEPPVAEGSVGNGTYLVGQTIQPGNYLCSTGDDDTYWKVNDATGDILDNGIGEMAFIGADGFSVEFERCSGTWEKVA